MRLRTSWSMLALLASWPACQLNNPVPVTPDYPPPTPLESSAKPPRAGTTPDAGPK